MKIRTLWLYYCLIRKMSHLGNLYSLTMTFFSFLAIRLQFYLKVQKLFIGPINIVLAITSRCNKDCHFCHYSEELNGPQNLADEMSYSQFVDIITSKDTSNFGRVCFYGGEPLLNQDLFKMLSYAKSKKYLTSMITNGLLINKYKDQLIKSQMNLMTVSYYPENRLELETNIASLEGQVPINLSFVFSAKRLSYLKEVVSFAKKHKISMVTLENMRQHNSGPDSAIFENDELFLSLKKEIDDEYGRNIIIRWSPLAKKNNQNIGKITCSEFWDTMYINAKSEINPCCQYPLESYTRMSKGHNSPLLIDQRTLFIKKEIPKLCEGCHYLSSKDSLYH